MRSSRWLLTAAAIAAAISLHGQPFERGDVIVSGGVDGPPAQARILVYSSNGVFKRQLVAEPGTGFGEVAFSPVTGILHVVAAGGIRRIDASGASQGTFGGGAYLAFDSAGRLVTTYHNDMRADLYDVSGTILQTRTLPLRAGPSDLAADQCTIVYFGIAADGLQRYDVCHGVALAPIGVGTVAAGPELRALRDGTMLAAQFGFGFTPPRVVRISPIGAILQAYGAYGELALAADGTSFWGAFGGMISRVDLQSSAVLVGPIATGLDFINGLAVFGEPVAPLAGVADTPALSWRLPGVLAALLAAGAVWTLRR